LSYYYAAWQQTTTQDINLCAGSDDARRTRVVCRCEPPAAARGSAQTLHAVTQGTIAVPGRQ
jgi:hypothetical protein